MSETRLKMMEAITRKQIVVTHYNGASIRLAPHLIFERHGDLFIRALNLSKSWRTDEEPRLGQFKLAGLGETELLAEAFDPLPSYDGTTPREDDVVILGL